MGTEDAGSYHCVAENVLGQAEVSTKKVSRVKSNLNKIYQRKKINLYSSNALAKKRRIMQEECLLKYIRVVQGSQLPRNLIIRAGVPTQLSDY